MKVSVVYLVYSIGHFKPVSRAEWNIFLLFYDQNIILFVSRIPTPRKFKPRKLTYIEKYLKTASEPPLLLNTKLFFGQHLGKISENEHALLTHRR